MARQAPRTSRPTGAPAPAQAAAASMASAAAADAAASLDGLGLSQAIGLAPLDLSQQVLQGWCEWQQAQAAALWGGWAWWAEWLREGSRLADLDAFTAADGNTPLAMFGPLQAAVEELARGCAQGANFAALRE